RAMRRVRPSVLMPRRSVSRLPSPRTRYVARLGAAPTRRRRRAALVVLASIVLGVTPISLDPAHAQSDGDAEGALQSPAAEQPTATEPEPAAASAEDRAADGAPAADTIEIVGPRTPESVLLDPASTFTQ